ncbi:MAG: alpha/beta hydrolase [Erysipelotrichaceae bacterium]|nr:alpha/beta hydrolase [Erysipelotrichaceae bacterium]
MKEIRFYAGEAEVHGVLQEQYETLKAHRIRPALVICPGGAYQWRSPREKDPVAFEFLSMGYQVFILEYSTEEKAKNFRPLKELAETVRTIRKNHEEWHIDPEKIAVLGFSAGGHLAASLGAFWNDPELNLGADSRPDALILCYPVISTKEFAHEESVKWVTGDDPLLKEKLHLPDHISSDFPPTFMWHGGQDTSVPVENSMMLAAALKRCRVPFEYHLFETGVHGISTCTQEVETPEEYCRQWVSLCKMWINRRFKYVP